MFHLWWRRLWKSSGIAIQLHLKCVVLKLKITQNACIVNLFYSRHSCISRVNESRACSVVEVYVPHVPVCVCFSFASSDVHLYQSQGAREARTSPGRLPSNRSCSIPLSFGRVCSMAHLKIQQIPGAFTSALSLIGHTDRCESRVVCLTSHSVQIPGLVMLIYSFLHDYAWVVRGKDGTEHSMRSC
jgi:hypothetical protein